MTKLFCILLTLLLSLSGPAMGEYSDFGCWSNAAKATVRAQSSIAAPLLKNQLAGQEIAGGHAFAKHAGEIGFTNPG